MVDQTSTPSDLIMKEEIPFNCVNWSMYIKLANKLDPDGSVSNNWRMLAEKLGYSTQDIMVFESQQTPHGRNTIKVLHEYSNQSDSTVNAVYRALEEIDRPDALEELKNGLPEIEKTYKQSLQKKHRHQDLQENEYMFTSGEDMAYPSNGYQGFPSSHQTQMLPPASKINMFPSSMHGTMPPASKPYHRQKSADVANVVDQWGRKMHNMYEHPSPEFKRQRSLPLTESMRVCGHDNHSQYFRELEPMDHAPSVTDDPVPLPMGMMRGMARYNDQANFGCMSNTVQSKDVMYQSNYSPPKPAVGRGLKLEIPAPMETFTRQNHSGFCSPSPTPTTPSTPLGRLQKLTNDRRYQPDESYNDMMRVKQEEEMSRSKVGNGPLFDGHDAIMNNLKQAHAGYNRQNEDMPCPRIKPTDPPNTFPMRIKSNSCSSTSSSVLSSSAQLTKSHSLPSNMKSAEYRKAFRHIKVFVTYAADNKRHTQRVLNLCQCLEKNGFTCCVDIFHRKLSEDERSTWCHSRFEEADFILCIMSPKYRQEVDTCEMDNDADDSDSVESEGENDRDDRPHRLHTKNIYRLMYREYSQVSNQRCSRFVPVLFQDMPDNLIPQWMMYAYNKLVYIWPKQYKDLLWMLTKPENRVPDHLTQSSDRCLQAETENQALSESDLKLEIK